VLRCLNFSIISTDGQDDRVYMIFYWERKIGRTEGLLA
jgi:hypothetical protein